MPRFEDLLPSGTVAEWTCGHTAGAVCAECYRLLAQRANQLAEEHMRTLEALEEARETIRRHQAYMTNFSAMPF